MNINNNITNRLITFFSITKESHVSAYKKLNPVNLTRTRTRYKKGEQPTDNEICILSYSSLKKVKRATPSPGPGSKRSATPEEDAEAVLAKRLKVAKETAKLEEYYYATLQGESDVLISEFKADMAFKCQLCKKQFMNNIQFMKHLHLHIESNRTSAIDFSDLIQCKYCYKDFDDAAKMEEHFMQTHIMKDMQTSCQICNVSLTSPARLVLHMSREHVKSEMPYCCQVCGYRTSIHREIIDHFHEVHDRTDKLQCPLCLKVFVLWGDKGYNTHAAISFMQHIQKHQDMKKKLDCKKCALTFINEQTLKSHVEKDHVSFKDYEDVECYQYVATDSPVIVPKPDERMFKAAPPKKEGLKPSIQHAFAAHNLEDVAFYDADRTRCNECDKTMTSVGHYLAYLCCTKCRYSTCCNKAMNVHAMLFHTQAEPQYDLGKPVMLDQRLYCVCGFSCFSGNKMAKHLGSSGCKTAYPSLESAGEGRASKEEEMVETQADEKEVAPLVPAKKNVVPGRVRVAGPRSHRRPVSQPKRVEEEDVDDPDTMTSSDEDTGAKDDDTNDPDFPEPDSELMQNGSDNEEESGKKKEKKDAEKTKEDENVRREGGGPILFGTLHKYMGDKKEEENGEVENKEEKEQVENDEEKENKELNGKEQEKISGEVEREEERKQETETEEKVEKRKEEENAGEEKLVENGEVENASEDEENTSEEKDGVNTDKVNDCSEDKDSANEEQDIDSEEKDIAIESKENAGEENKDNSEEKEKNSEEIEDISDKKDGNGCMEVDGTEATDESMDTS